MKTVETPEHGIAVVGLACWYPGARSPRELWENILARRRQFRTFPDVRLPLSAYHDPDRSAPDKTYGTRGAFIDGFLFDLQKRRVPRSTYDSTDIAHWLALEVALQAIEDAGYSQNSIPKERSGVIVGNTLTGEQTRSTSMRLRWPFVQRSLAAAAKASGLSEAWLNELSASMEEYYKSVFPPITEDTLAGGLSNTIAGRICNFLNLNGGGYTVDGACSSSLLAVATGARAIACGDLDLALVGGVDISLDPFEIVGFAKTGALTPDHMSVYDKKGHGFLPGEGCGFAMLKKLELARRDQDPIYAVLKGWGISSDGKGGITAPKAEGQALALRRAYELAGYAPSSVHFIEGHGTGTTVGDRVELEGVALARSADTHLSGIADTHLFDAEIRPCGMTSIKSILGHTKAAAGIAGFLKAVLGVNQRVIPPTAGCDEANATFATKARALYPVMRGEVLAGAEKMRAGVSAMGFGGINCHVTVESADAPSARFSPGLNERALLASAQSTELFVFSATSIEDLLAQVGVLQTRAEGISEAELADLSAEVCLASQKGSGRFRAALLAKTPVDLLEKLPLLRTPASPKTIHRGIFLGNNARPPRLAFLFPGQGSQQVNMARTLIERHAWAKELASHLDLLLEENGLPSVLAKIDRPTDSADTHPNWVQELADTQVAQPAICLASILWLKRLAELGVTPQLCAGHSLGELSALYAAGSFNERILLRLAAERGRAMANSKNSHGTMASLACDKNRALALCSAAPGYVVVANINGPTQTVVSGEISCVEAVLALAEREGISGRRLKVSNAFHSEIVREGAEKMRSLPFLAGKNAALKDIKVYSGIDGKELKTNEPLSEHFGRQILAQVDFVSLVNAISPQCDFMIEVGPGRVLSDLVTEILGENATVRCLPVESKANRDQDLNTLLGRLHVLGQDIKWEALFKERLIRPFVPACERQFIENPCEHPFGKFADLTTRASQPIDLPQATIRPKSLAVVPQSKEKQTASTSSIFEQLAEEIVQRTGFEPSSITPQLRLLDDLNLDSIKAGELIGRVSRKLGIPGKIDPIPLANATLEELEAVYSQHLQESRPAATTAPATPESWVRCFAWDLVEAPLLASLQNIEQNAPFLVVTDPDIAATHAEIASCLSEQLGNDPTITCISSGDLSSWQGKARHVLILLQEQILTEESLRTWTQILAFAAKLSIHSCSSLTFLNFGGEVPCKSFAASLHLENPELRVRSIQIPSRTSLLQALKIAVPELMCKETFLSVTYDENGRRFTYSPTALETGLMDRRPLEWHPSDVVLVTGGAKGITAKCALAFAQAHRTKMALIGSSPARTDDKSCEISQTLALYRKSGLEARYYRCDVSDRTALSETTQNVENDLGKITAVLHGAGVNHPRRTGTVDQDQAYAEISPKTLGALHLSEIFQGKNLKLFCAFTSIIGMTGMPGNGWYALSNEWTDQLVDNFAKSNAMTATFSIAYSVWDEVGMGARIGSVEHLAQKGIAAIPVAGGVKRFLELCSKDSGCRQVTVAARLGGLDTWKPLQRSVKATDRFLDKILQQETGVEVVVETKLHPDLDPYLRDHLHKGSLLFPTVFGLEAMAQVANLTLPSNAVAIDEREQVEIEDIRLERPIVVPPEQGLTIQIHAQCMERQSKDEPLKVRVGIRCESSDFAQDHFSATFVCKENSQMVAETLVREWPQEPLPLVPKRDLYGPILFQGPSFQRMEQILALTSEKVHQGVCQFVVRGENTNFCLGDPYASDALLQSVQLIVPQDFCLPVRIGQLQLTRTQSVRTGLFRCETLLEERSGDIYRASIRMVDPLGGCLLKLSGYELKVLEERPTQPSLADLCDPSARDQARLLAELQHLKQDFQIELPQVAFRHIPNLAAQDKKARHVSEAAVLAELDPRLQLSWEASGKPTSSEGKISISHEGACLLVVLGEEEQGCDLTLLEKRDDDILGPYGKQLASQLRGKGDSQDVAIARAWCASEAAFKAQGVTGPFSLDSEKECGTEKLLRLGDSSLCVLTFPFRATIGGTFMVALCTWKQAKQPASNGLGYKENAQDFWIERDDAGKFHAAFYRFPLLMEDTGTLSRHVPFSRFHAWMGKMREISLMPVLPQLVQLTQGGKWGIVTNDCETMVCGEASGQDYIVGKLRLLTVPTEIAASTMHLCCDWHIEKLDGTHELFARTSMRTTWVRILGHGLTKREELPNFFRDFLIKLGSQDPAALSLLTAHTTFDHLSGYLNSSKSKKNRGLRSPLHREIFKTDLEESNLVGNIYFSNYTRWLARTRDRFFYNLNPRLYEGTGQSGEWLCLRTSVEHLREAMPFDTIEVTLSLQELLGSKAVFHCEYYRLKEGESPLKLAIGEQEALWITRDEAGLPRAAPLPCEYALALVGELGVTIPAI